MRRDADGQLHPLMEAVSIEKFTDWHAPPHMKDPPSTWTDAWTRLATSRDLVERVRSQSLQYSCGHFILPAVVILFVV